MKSVYIFRGAPATGKGTVVPAFIKLLPTPAALITEDTFRWDFHLASRTIQDVTDDEHMFAYRNMVRIYEEYLKNGTYTIVLEGLFTWDDMRSSQGSARELAEIARTHGFTVRSIVLKADKKELLKRNKLRNYSVPVDEFNQLYANVYKTVADEEMVIDSTHQTAEQTLETLKHLASLGT